ncbi:MAG: NAD(P)-dependent oxidoreductase [Candidatus Hydrogenedentes bacterium]|nr:NAD(P)-dependent oxidoreductase [Candidatus Hydrogenedentota bacterium]
MRVLVTGASGHVGGAVVLALHAAGMAVLAASRSPLAGFPPDVQPVRADLRGPIGDTLRPVLAECDAVVHCAAALPPAPDDEIAAVNTAATRGLVALARECGVRQMLFLSSMSLLRRPLERPITEAHPVAPDTAYAQSKYDGEAAVLDADSGLTGTVFRITSPVGPGLRRDTLFPRFVCAAAQGAPLTLNGRGTRRQDYVDVRDIAEAVVRALSARAGGLFNIASGVPVSNRELAERCCAVLDSRSEILFSGMPDPDDEVVWEVCIEKARQTLGWTPSQPLDASIRDFYRSLV